MRKALLVGINYTGTPNQLYGCINDINNMGSYLQKVRKYNSFIIMSDISTIKPTRKLIVDYDEDGKIETGAEEHAGSVDKAIKKAQAEKKVDESIFALTNQWTAYKG